MAPLGYALDCCLHYLSLCGKLVCLIIGRFYDRPNETSPITGLCTTEYLRYLETFDKGGHG
jgi:hypothetical protein